MTEKNYLGLIPEHTSGKVIKSEATTELTNAEEAKTFFYKVRDRFLKVTDWHDMAGIISARFFLIDPTGKEVDRLVQEGDYFKIDIPGPGSKAGDGYDWVQVEELKEIAQEDVNSVGFRVRPTANPLDREHADVAHFYSNESTSTFIVTREQNSVSATIYDSNTKANTESENLTDKIRHVAVGLGALAGFSKIQWQNLAEGLVKKD